MDAYVNYADTNMFPATDTDPMFDMDGGHYYPKPTAEDMSAYENDMKNRHDVPPDGATEPVAENPGEMPSWCFGTFYAKTS